MQLPFYSWLTWPVVLPVMMKERSDVIKQLAISCSGATDPHKVSGILMLEMYYAVFAVGE